MTAERLITPEALLDLPWEVRDQVGYDWLKNDTNEMRLRLFDKPKAIRGGKILGLAQQVTGITRPESDKSLEEFLSSERDIGVFPAFEGETSEPNRLIFLLNEKGPRHFEANLVAWKGYYAAFLKERWEKAGRQGSPPVPKALKTYQLTDGRIAIVTGYEHGCESLGLGEPDIAVHEADLKQLPDPDNIKAMDRFINVLDGVTVKSQEFLGWAQYKDIPESWLKEGHAKCALRGHEW